MFTVKRDEAGRWSVVAGSGAGCVCRIEASVCGVENSIARNQILRCVDASCLNMLVQPLVSVLIVGAVVGVILPDGFYPTPSSNFHVFSLRCGEESRNARGVPTFDAYR